MADRDVNVSGGRNRGTLLFVIAAVGVPLVAAAQLGIAPAVVYAASTYRQASTAEVSVVATSMTMAEGAAAKTVRIQIRNAGPNPATRLSLAVDPSGLNPAKLRAVSLSDRCSGGPVNQCDLSELGDLPVHGTFWIGLRLERLGSAGPAGTVTVKVSAATPDPNQTNNVSTSTVQIAGHGVDIVTAAHDLTDVRQRRGNFDWAMINAGDAVVKGLRYTVTLPPRVTFTDRDPGCTFSTNRRTAVCTLPDLILEPGHSINPNNDGGMNVVATVATPGPIIIPGGIVTAEPIQSVPLDDPPTPAATTRHDPTASVAPNGLAVDLDPRDNSFPFAVHVDAAPSPSDSPDGLPVTGGRAGLLAAAGMATVGVGVIVLLAVRRRRGARAEAG